MNCKFFSYRKILSAWIGSTPNLLGEGGEDKVEGSWSFQLHKLFELPTFGDGHVQIMLHFFGRVSDRLLFLQLILDVIE